ncbi:MFS general substrate transporter, partial [Aureobasidium melanogenum]
MNSRDQSPSKTDKQIRRNAQYGLQVLPIFSVECIRADDQSNSIIDPLSAMDDATLLQHVKDFRRKKGLEDVVSVETLQQGARLATRQQRGLDNLTNTEKKELKWEEDGELRSLTKTMRVLLFTCAIAAIVQGWSQESIVGANLEWPSHLGIQTKDEPLEGQHLRYFGIVNAMPYFAASVLGAWVSDPITYVYGRRTALFFAALCSFAAPIGSAYCRTWYQLLACRLIQGVGMGAKASVVPVMESEVAPPKLRGRLLVSWQTFVAFGIFLGASANCIFNGHWRWQIGIAFIPAVPLLCLCYVMPESPRWLARKGQYREAFLAFVELRATPLQAARDLFLVYVQSRVEHLQLSKKDLTTTTLSRSLDEDEEVFTESTSNVLELGSRVFEFFANILGLFRDGRNRHAVVASGIVMIAQDQRICFSGDNRAQQLKRSIRPDKNSMDGVWVVPFMYSSEIFPQKYREVGMSLAVAINLSFAGALAMAVPQYQENLNDEGRHLVLLGSFAALDFVAAILVWLLMRYPERAVELEDMNVSHEMSDFPV